MYGRPDKWFNYLKKNLGAQFLVQDESSFIEMKARRDVLEHNNGIVEVTYREKAKAAAKFDLGSLVKLTEQDIDEAHHLIQRLITDAGVSVIARLKTP